MPNAALKRKQVRIYLDDEDSPVFDSLLAKSGKLSETALMTMIVSAGLKAIEQGGGRITLPLQLEMASPSSGYLLNETPAKARK
jgi:hypothetical protein